uniref:ANK_REP_REGION domain-containing protein n=1 Tax=Syphacia muris TaxID=451379 RepID=A0A0N5AIK7_9BILA
MGKQSKKNFAIRELERQLAKALQKGNDQLVSDLYIDIAEEYRRNKWFSDSIEAYKSSLIFAEKYTGTENAAFCHRAIAEMSIDSSIGDDQEALLHGREYFRLAKKSNQVHLVQLAYHVYGWLQFQVYLNTGAKDKKLLIESRNWCEKGLKYLDKNAPTIDSDTKAVKIGQNSRARRARLRQVLSQIYDKLGESSRALVHHNAAFAYAVKEMDFDLQYRCLLSKLNFSGDQRIKTAVDLVYVASNLGTKEHVDSKFILAQEKIRAIDLDGAKWDMESMFTGKDVNFLDSDELEYFKQCLVTVYKTLERLKAVDKMSNFNQMKLYERIADEFIDLDFRETALVFYEKMMYFTESATDKIKSLVSIAETARELSDYEKAYDCYAKIEKLESGLQLESKKQAETAICLLSVATKVDHFSISQIKILFEKAEKLVVTSHQKKTLYEIYLEYLEGSVGTECDREEIKLKFEQVSTIEDNSDEKYESEEVVDSWKDQLSDMSAADILVLCEMEGSRRNMEERIHHERDKKINLYGETRMHEAARGNDLAYMKLLVDAGYNINVQDEGGWTPLHEAVGALKLENVRLLIQAGANLDIKSNEGTLSAEGERTDSGGLTPLMEACDRGATAIVELLLDHGADVTLQNRDNWSALDFFRNAIHVGLVERDDIPAANKLISVIEKKLRKAHAPVNDVPPPKKLLKKVNSNGSQGKNFEICNTLFENKELYQKGAQESLPVVMLDSAMVYSESLLDSEEEASHSATDFTPKPKRFRLSGGRNVQKRINNAECADEILHDFEEDTDVSLKRKSSYTDDSLVSRSVTQTSNVEDNGKSEVKQVSANSSPLSSTSQDWLFVKINFKNKDGFKVKVKGIPFNRNATIADVRDRCIKEICNDGENISLSITIEDCELSDETPINLVLNSANNSLDCTIGEISRLTPKETYLKNVTVLKNDILRALNEANGGRLDFSNCSVGRDAVALTKTLSAFPVNFLNELNLSGNLLEIGFFQPISFLARSLDVLKLKCCGIDSRGIETLLDNKTICPQLSCLDISFNNLSSFSATSLFLSFIRICPNLKDLYVSACEFNDVLLQSFSETVASLAHLESLDVSCNSCVNSKVVTNIVSHCERLSKLDVSYTEFLGFDFEELRGSHHLNRLLVVGCNISSRSFLESLGSLNSLCFIDLSLTNITSEDLRALILEKSTKLPVTTLKLHDCVQLEAQHFVEIMQNYFSTETAIHFYCPTELKDKSNIDEL